MPQLFILRHGQAQAEGVDGDFIRELTPKGKKEAESVGHWLKQQQFIPEVVWSSAAVRTMQTAEIALQVIASEISLQLKMELYLARSKQLHSILKTCPNTIKRLLIVGHNPGLEQLLNDLITERDRRYHLATANLAVLTIHSNWQLLDSVSLDYFIQP